MMHRILMFTLFGLFVISLIADASVAPIVPAGTTILEVSPQTYSANVVQSVSDNRGFAYSTVQEHLPISSPIIRTVHSLPLRYDLNGLQFIPNVGGYYLADNNPLISSNLVPIQQFESTSGNEGEIKPVASQGEISNTGDDSVTIEAN